MTTTDPKEFVQRVKAYCDKATPGPWTTFSNANWKGMNTGVMCGPCDLGDENRLFIACARTDLPAACKLIEQQAAEIAKRDEILKHYGVTEVL